MKPSARSARVLAARPPAADPSRLRSRAGKAAEDNLFDKITPEKVNKHLQTLLPGLTIKVFRTYNASFTQSRLLKETDTNDTVMGKKKQARRAQRRLSFSPAGSCAGPLTCPPFQV